MHGDDKRASEQDAVEEPVDETLRLDGNAAGGILSEVFIADLTSARVTCANCGTIRELGALLVYAHGMGTVMRCSSCNAVVLRVARTPTKLWFDLTGAKLVLATAGGRPVEKPSV